MPKENLTDITFILDRTGSMQSIKDETISVFNQFLEDQKTAEGECLLTLVQFDSFDPFEILRNAEPIADVQPLDAATYIPRGFTPLWDAIGKGIGSTGKRLEAMDEPQRPGKVLFVILTDGQENASKEYTSADAVLNLVEHQQEKYGWQFVYLGANQDAIKTAGLMGIKPQMTADFAATGQGVTRAVQATSSKLKQYRASGQSSALHYTDEERKSMK